MPKYTTGLTKRGDIWYIDKALKEAPGGRLRESTGYSNRQKAEEYLIWRVDEVKKDFYFKKPIKHNFEEASEEYLRRNKAKRSYIDDEIHLKAILPFIGHLPLHLVDKQALKDFIEVRRHEGIKQKSINNAVEVVRALLNQAADEWKDANGHFWLKSAPKIKLDTVEDSLERYFLSFEEQDDLIEALPPHLKQMALFKVNTGTRQQEVCGLRWDWEMDISDSNETVFLIPGKLVKNGKDRLVVHNRIAKAVIEAQRVAQPDTHTDQCTNHQGQPCNCNYTYVFSYQGRRLKRMNNSAWARAWKKTGLPSDGTRFVKGVHNLKHTFGTRLLKANVSFELRQKLLGHVNKNVTSHYCAIDPMQLIEAVREVEPESLRHKSPSSIILRRKRKA